MSGRESGRGKEILVGLVEAVGLEYGSVRSYEDTLGNVN